MRGEINYMKLYVSGMRMRNREMEKMRRILNMREMENMRRIDTHYMGLLFGIIIWIVCFLFAYETILLFFLFFLFWHD